MNPTITRLFRYAISGAASALTHFGVGLFLTQALSVRPIAASTVGFLASVGVSYGLQHAWVFQSSATHIVASARFLVVTAVAFALNTLIIWLGTEVLPGPYPLAQAGAIVLIPLVNYSINSRWTFRLS